MKAFSVFYSNEREIHLLQKLAKRLQAQLEVMTRSTYEIMAKAPEGYVWVDNGQEEIYEQQWDGESRRQVKNNLAERMSKGLTSTTELV